MPKFLTLPIVAAALHIALMAPVQAATLDEMAGQMIIVGFAGNSTDAKAVKALRDDLAAGHIGGVMYLKTNIASLGAVKEMNAAFRAAASDLPPFITLDQEGGMVERLTRSVGFTEVPTAADVAQTQSPEQAQKTYEVMAKGIADLGFTLNFGPVADLNVNPNNQIIAKFGRSYGSKADTVVAYDKAFIAAHHEYGLLTALKHFPGHGSSTKDSHEGFVDISKTWSQAELEPYRALITSDQADMVMVGHLFHSDYSKGDVQLPASLSPQWITDVLRGDLGFKGVVISDDLEMGAIREHFSLKDTVVRAVRSGMDVLLFSNTAKYRPGLGEEIRAILLAEAAADPDFARRIEESYNRIVALKQRIGD